VSERSRVVVVGGGISGLSAAWFLATESEKVDVDVEVTLVEAAPRIGGTLGTETIDGFIFERGPNGFLDNAPDTLELVRELDLESELREASPNAKHRYLLKDGRLQPLPTGPGAFLRSKLLSLSGKLRAFTEPFRGTKQPGEEDSVASFGKRRFGREVTKTFLDPVATGIYAGDIERLSVESAFPRLAAMEREHGGVFKAMKAAKKAKREGTARADGSGAEKKSAFGAKLSSFAGGLETLSERMREQLGDRVVADCAVESIRPSEADPKTAPFSVHFRDGRVEDYDRVVVAAPAARAASLFAAKEPDLARALEAIPYAAVAVVCLGFRREDVEHALDGYGFLIPRDQGVRTLGAIWTSSIFPDHAPSDCVSLRIMVGGARDPDAVDLSAEELEDLVRREIGEVLGIRGEPVARRVYRYTQGIPQYNVGHARRLDRIEDQRRRVPRLWLVGNAYRGVGINDCIRDAKSIAREVLADLKSDLRESA